MASCGYHSPRFSEDAAWLPAWLQPHQFPTFGDGAKDDRAVSQMSCKTLASVPDNISNGQDCQYFNGGHSKTTAYHLYLSGDDNSPAGNIAISAEALNFRLHLSSLGISHHSTSYPNEMPHSLCHETNERSTQKHLPEIQVLNDNAICHNTVEDEAPILGSPSRNKSKLSHKQKSRPLLKTDKKNQLRQRGKHGDRNICNAVIDDAVELSIAASEALVISGIVSNSQCENFPAAEILEIALRVRQARKECNLEILEAVSSFPADELGENDPLSDLDENAMADAYEDVGITLTQIVESPDGSLHRTNFLQSNPSSDLKTHVSESQSGFPKAAESNTLKAPETIVNGAAFPICAAVAVDSISKYLPVQPLSAHQTKPSHFVPIDDRMKPTSKNHKKANAKILQENAEALITNATGCKEGGGMHKDGKVSILEDTTMRKSTRAFIETSFISESMDEMDELSAEQMAEREPEIVASSSTPFIDLSRCPCREAERSIYEGRHLLEDLTKSSGLSEVDPLCSMVPCSITSEDAPICPSPEGTKEEGEKHVEPKRGVSPKELDEVALPDVQKAALKPLTGGLSSLSKCGVQDPVAPTRKQFSSLRHYSTIMSNPNINRPIPAQSIARQLMLFPCGERDDICVVSKIPDGEISLKPMSRCTDVHESQDNEGRGKFRGVCANGEARDDDNEALIHLHEDVGQPIILNNRKRRLRACNRILNRDGKEKSPKESSTSEVEEGNKLTDEVNCDNQTNFTSLPLLSSLHSHRSKQGLMNKRVRFMEAKSSLDRTDSNNRLQSKRQACGSYHRSSKKVKESGLKKKSVLRKREKLNYLTCQLVQHEKRMIFQGLEFLLTGFSRQREKEFEALIRQYGGYVLTNIPSNSPELRGKQQGGLMRFSLPIVLSPKKVRTTKFLYGCASNTWTLNSHWLTDSIHAASLLPPGKYMTRLIQGSELNQLRIGEPFCSTAHTFIFEGMGIMLNGKVNFCTKFSKIVKHGGGQVFKSLQQLVQSLKNGMTTLGAVLVESEDSVSRHLKHCALENNLQTVPASWIVNSLFSGKLLPFKKDRYAPLHRIKMPTFSRPQDDDMSEEI